MLEGNFSRRQHPRKGTRQTTDDKSCGRRVLRDGIDVYMNGLEDMVVGVNEARSWRRAEGKVLRVADEDVPLTPSKLPR